MVPLPLCLSTQGPLLVLPVAFSSMGSCLPVPQSGFSCPLPLLSPHALLSQNTPRLWFLEASPSAPPVTAILLSCPPGRSHWKVTSCTAGFPISHCPWPQLVAPRGRETVSPSFIKSWCTPSLGQECHNPARGTRQQVLTSAS